MRNMVSNKKALEKTNRVRDCIFYRNPKAVAIQDMFYWDDFVKNWREYFGFTRDVDIFNYYDLDIVCCSPNIDPFIKNVIEITKTIKDVIYRGGFGSVLKLDFSQPVPGFIDYYIKDTKDLKDFIFEDPEDNRRYNNSFAPCDQYYTIPSFNEQVAKYKDDFCIFGNICEARETVWRMIGLENELMTLEDCPEIIADFAEKSCRF